MLTEALVCVIRYREWPESGLSKFEDILGGIGDVVRAADYFFFLDGDVRFNEEVPLSDVAAGKRPDVARLGAGLRRCCSLVSPADRCCLALQRAFFGMASCMMHADLTAVEHPFYPRYVMGFCTPDNAAGRGFCGYPYDRNPKSQIQIPEGSGKYFVKIVDPKAEKGYYYIVKANSWYIQSAFWGGKTKFVVPMLEDLAARVTIDRSHNIYSQVVQDERYVNWCKFTSYPLGFAVQCASRVRVLICAPVDTVLPIFELRRRRNAFAIANSFLDHHPF